MNQNDNGETIRGIMDSCRVLAVVGMSRDPGKAAGGVPRFLEASGYTVIPINPNAENMEGRKTYLSLLDIEENIDAVVIFRPSGEIPIVVAEAVKRRQRRGDLRVLWMQEGIRNEAAARLAEKHGIRVVQDRCMAKEFHRLYENGQNSA